MWRAEVLLRSVLAVIALSFVMMLAARDTVAQPPVTLDRVQSIAFLNASTGLVTSTDPPHNTYIFTKDGSTIIPGLNDAKSLTVQDPDVAWCTIGKGLYRGDLGWTRWTLVDTELAHVIVGTANGQAFFMSNGSLYSATAAGVALDTGLLPNDAIIQIDYLSPRTIFGFGGYGLYRSTDGGHEWSLYYPTTARGLFIDRVHRRMYLGGPLRVSTDDGANWTEIPGESQYPFTALYGTISGAHDCTGAFYIAPYGNTTDAYRFGEDGFFHNVGPVLLGQPPGPGLPVLPGLLQVFDGGAIAYSLADRYVTFTGIGGDLTDSAKPQLIASAAPLTLDLCGSGRDSLSILIASRTCLTISIDSVRALRSLGSVTAVKSARSIAGTSTTISLPYKASTAGDDTVAIRIYLHNVQGRGYRESLDLTSVVHVTGSAAVLAAPSIIDFGTIPIDSVSSRSIVIHNTGCLALAIDSLVSSRASLFAVKPRTFPVTIAHRDSATFIVTYHPTTSGEDLESLEIGTNAGHRFITLTGRAARTVDVADEGESPTYLAIELSDRALLVSSNAPARIECYTLLGQMIGEWVIRGETSIERCDLQRPLASGAYYVRLRMSGHADRTLRLIVP